MTHLPDTGEFLLIFLSLIGAVTVFAFVASAVLAGVKYVLDPSTWQAVVQGTPWAVGGLVVGIVLMVAVYHPDRGGGVS